MKRVGDVRMAFEIMVYIYKDEIAERLIISKICGNFSPKSVFFAVERDLPSTV